MGLQGEAGQPALPVSAQVDSVAICLHRLQHPGLQQLPPRTQHQQKSAPSAADFLPACFSINESISVQRAVVQPHAEPGKCISGLGCGSAPGAASTASPGAAAAGSPASRCMASAVPSIPSAPCKARPAQGRSCSLPRSLLWSPMGGFAKLVTAQKVRNRAFSKSTVW